MCVFSELPGAPRACNFLFSESPIFLQLRALCPAACDSVLTNRYCPVGRMVAGTKELLSGFYSNPGSEIYEWTFRTVMWITSAQSHATKDELLGCPLPSFVIRGRNILKLSFYPLLISRSIPPKYGLLCHYLATSLSSHSVSVDHMKVWENASYFSLWTLLFFS